MAIIGPNGCQKVHNNPSHQPRNIQAGFRGCSGGRTSRFLKIPPYKTALPTYLTVFLFSPGHGHRHDEVLPGHVYPGFDMERYKAGRGIRSGLNVPLRKLSKGMQKQAAFLAVTFPCGGHSGGLDEPVDGLGSHACTPPGGASSWRMWRKTAPTVLVSLHNLHELGRMRPRGYHEPR